MAASDKSLPQTLQELRDLLRDYASQEITQPLKGLGKFLGFGVAGSVCLGIGVILLTIAALRALQEEATSTFDGNWSFAPYLISLLVGVVVIGLAVKAINAKGKATK